MPYTHGLKAGTSEDMDMNLNLTQKGNPELDGASIRLDWFNRFHDKYLSKLIILCRNQGNVPYEVLEIYVERVIDEILEDIRLLRVLEIYID